jgi:hypothetical protein
LPRPSLDATLERTIGQLRHRKLDRKPGAAQSAAARPARRGVPIVPILLGAIALVAIAGGALLYVATNRKPEPGPYGVGPAAARSATARPDWIGPGAAPGDASCAERGGGYTCVGVSPVSSSQEDAEDEASEAALEAIAFELGKHQPQPVVAMYLPSRAAKLAALARDPQSAQARREVREGRHAVALALRALTTPTVARYWEAFDGRDGRRFVAFVEATLAPAEAKQLAAAYAARETALGATVLPACPELAWRFSRLYRGVVIVALARGPLQELGITEHDIVLAIDGRDVDDPAGFAKIATEEIGALEDRGGLLRVVVQTETGDPRELSTAIAGKHVEPAPVPRGAVHPDVGPGGVNVWDRYGGSRGSAGDDPAQ